VEFKDSAVWASAKGAVLAWQRFDMDQLWGFIESAGFDGELRDFDLLGRSYCDKLRKLMASRIGQTYKRVRTSTVKSIMHFEDYDTARLVETLNSMGCGMVASSDGDYITIEAPETSADHQLSDNGVDETEVLARLATFLEQDPVSVTIT
jgi:hypothetical protein